MSFSHVMFLSCASLKLHNVPHEGEAHEGLLAMTALIRTHSVIGYWFQENQIYVISGNNGSKIDVIVAYQ